MARDKGPEWACATVAEPDGAEGESKAKNVICKLYLYSCCPALVQAVLSQTCLCTNMLVQAVLSQTCHRLGVVVQQLAPAHAHPGPTYSTWGRLRLAVEDEEMGQ
eukprot:1144206-Pelagomonas_calceolata.AAC.2